MAIWELMKSASYNHAPNFAVELADEAIKTTADDGRIDMAEAAAILRKLAQKLPELKGK